MIQTSLEVTPAPSIETLNTRMGRSKSEESLPKSRPLNVTVIEKNISVKTSNPLIEIQNPYLSDKNFNDIEIRITRKEVIKESFIRFTARSLMNSIRTLPKIIKGDKNHLKIYRDQLEEKSEIIQNLAAETQRWGVNPEYNEGYVCRNEECLNFVPRNNFDPDFKHKVGFDTDAYGEILNINKYCSCCNQNLEIFWSPETVLDYTKHALNNHFTAGTLPPKKYSGSLVMYYLNDKTLGWFLGYPIKFKEILKEKDGVESRFIRTSAIISGENDTVLFADTAGKSNAARAAEVREQLSNKFYTRADKEMETENLRLFNSIILDTLILIFKNNDLTSFKYTVQDLESYKTQILSNKTRRNLVRYLLSLPEITTFFLNTKLLKRREKIDPMVEISKHWQGLDDETVKNAINIGIEDSKTLFESAAKNQIAVVTRALEGKPDILSTLRGTSGIAEFYTLKGPLNHESKLIDAGNEQGAFYIKAGEKMDKRNNGKVKNLLMKIYNKPLSLLNWTKQFIETKMYKLLIQNYNEYSNESISATKSTPLTKETLYKAVELNCDPEYKDSVKIFIDYLLSNAPDLSEELIKESYSFIIEHTFWDNSESSNAAYFLRNMNSLVKARKYRELILKREELELDERMKKTAYYGIAAGPAMMALSPIITAIGSTYAVINPEFRGTWATILSYCGIAGLGGMAGFNRTVLFLPLALWKGIKTNDIKKNLIEHFIGIVDGGWFLTALSLGANGDGKLDILYDDFQNHGFLGKTKSEILALLNTTGDTINYASHLVGNSLLFLLK